MHLPWFLFWQLNSLSIHSSAFPFNWSRFGSFLFATVCVCWENWFGILSRDIIWYTLLQSVTHSLSGLWVHRWGGYGWLQGLILTHVFSIHLISGNSSATLTYFHTLLETHDQSTILAADATYYHEEGMYYILCKFIWRLRYASVFDSHVDWPFYGKCGADHCSRQV
jgi:hypothetical protein